MADLNSSIQVARAQERERCIAEIRRIQKRNTLTQRYVTRATEAAWKEAVETMAAECIDAIKNP